MTEQQIAAFLDDPHVETLFLVQQISDTDTGLTLDVYSRNQRHAKQALGDLRAAIDVLLDEWNKHLKLPPSTSGSEKRYYAHSGIKWPLHIRRPSTTH